MEILTEAQLIKESQAAYQKGDYLSAAKLFTSTAEIYLSEGDRLAWAEMLNNSSVAYLRAGEAKLSLEAAAGTDQIFASVGDLKRQGMALGNQAAAFEALKRYDEALEAYEKSAAMFKEIGEDELRAIVYQSISRLNLRKGHYLEAYATMRMGVADIKKPNFRQRLLNALLEVPFKLIK